MKELLKKTTREMKGYKEIATTQAIYGQMRLLKKERIMVNLNEAKLRTCSTQNVKELIN